MRRLLLIANPSASGFTGAGFRDAVSTLEERFSVTPVWPESPAEARQCAADGADDGAEVVVAMGGDGVVHHVANGLVGTPTALGILPAGTTNVLARIHRMPLSLTKAAQALLTAEPELVPAAHVSTESGTAARSEYAIFNVGVGFDADVVTVAEQRPHAKLYFGSFHYARTAAGRIFGPYRGRPPNLRVECDGARVDAVTVFVQVHDTYTFFGPAPMRLLNEREPGLATVALERITPRVAVGVLGRLSLRRSLAGIPGVHVWKDVRKLIIEADPPSPFQADGELLGAADAVEINPVPNAIAILTPATA